MKHKSCDIFSLDFAQDSIAIETAIVSDAGSLYPSVSMRRIEKKYVARLLVYSVQMFKILNA